MARSDLLLQLTRAGAKGDQVLFRRALEAIAAEERAKQHHVLAQRLAEVLGNGALSSQKKTLFGNGLEPRHRQPGVSSWPVTPPACRIPIM